MDSQQKAQADLEWSMRYASHVPEFLKTHFRFLGEDVRRYMLDVKNIGRPLSPNQWGSAFREHITAGGFVIPAGKSRSAASKKSHGHVFREWQSLLCASPGSLVTLNEQLIDLARRVNSGRELSVLDALKLAAQYAVQSQTTG
jgi:hypothetical protein